MTMNALVTVPKAGPLAVDRAGFEGLTGADLQVPFLNQVQSLSPEIDKTSPKHIPGAELGVFFNSVTRELFDKVEIVPATTQKSFVEWTPRSAGGGFAGVHTEGSEVVREAMARNGGRIIQSKGGKIIGLTTPAGNDLVQTFYLFALVIKEGEVAGMVVIPFARTKVKPFREYTTLTFSTPPAVPLGRNRALVTGVKETNKGGQPYFNVSLSPVVKEGTLIQRILASRLEEGSTLAVAADQFRITVLQGRVAVDYRATETTTTEGSGDSVFA